jgi:hypothetical protein
MFRSGRWNRNTAFFRNSAGGGRVEELSAAMAARAAFRSSLMSARVLSLTALFAVAVSSGAVGEEPSSEPLYVVPPPGLKHLSQPRALLEVVARPLLPPVEAPRPAPRIEVVMTPVGEMTFSCSIAFQPDSLIAAPAGALQAEAVTVVFEPVVAPRPAL